MWVYGWLLSEVLLRVTLENTVEKLFPPQRLAPSQKRSEKSEMGKKTEMEKKGTRGTTGRASSASLVISLSQVP